MAFKTKSDIHSRIVEEVKSDNSQFPIILAIVKNFSFERIFWKTDWRANNEQSNFFGTEWKLNSLPLTSKAASVTSVKVFGTG